VVAGLAAGVHALFVVARSQTVVAGTGVGEQDVDAGIGRQPAHARATRGLQGGAALACDGIGLDPQILLRSGGL